MADFFTQLDKKLQSFIEAQKIFFVATAPEEGRINLSPKGMDTFLVLNEKQVCYLDLTGSGNETAAHIQHNPRITVMFCSFDKQPLIMRLYGTAKVILPSDEAWTEVVKQFTLLPGSRQVIHIDIDSLQTSCGYAVPMMEFQEHRQTLKKWAENKGEDGIRRYQLEKNVQSIDGKEIGINYDENN